MALILGREINTEWVIKDNNNSSTIENNILQMGAKI